MQPENGDTMGVVVDVALPNSEKAIVTYSEPSGGVLVKWDGWGVDVFYGVEVLQSPDEVLFVRRKGESPRMAITYRCGERVEPGDIVMQRGNGDTTGVVVQVILPYTANAVWYDMRSGGVIVKWDGGAADVSIDPDVLRQEVCFVRRKDE